MGSVLIGCPSGLFKVVMPTQDYPLCLIVITKIKKSFTSTLCQSRKWQKKELGQYIFSWPYPWLATHAHMCSTAIWEVTLLICFFIFYYYYFFNEWFIQQGRCITVKELSVKLVLKIKSFLPSASKNCKLLFSSCFLRLQVIDWCHFLLY